mmetsp:Transcript_47221/g.136026  ORF Transcript_47221/g.136026 Transcript_47221/m.136026 type:complete len:200 (+) Transcript_47221:542-1141(+)
MSVRDANLVDWVSVRSRCQCRLGQFQNHQLGNIIFAEPIHECHAFFTSGVEAENLGGLTLRQFIELNAVGLCEVELRSSPEDTTTVHFPRETHRLPSLLLVDTLISLFTHGSIEMIFVVIGLNFLKANNVWRDIDDFSQDVLKPVIPRKSPDIAVRILLLCGIDLGQNIVRSDSKASATPSRSNLVRDNISFWRIRGSG